MKLGFCGTKQWYNEQLAFFCALPLYYLLSRCRVTAVAALSYRDCERMQQRQHASGPTIPSAMANLLKPEDNQPNTTELSPHLPQCM